jgi:hypothetical protein
MNIGFIFMNCYTFIGYYRSIIFKPSDFWFRKTRECTFENSRLFNIDNDISGFTFDFWFTLKKDYVNNDGKKQEKHTANCERTSCFNWLSSTIIRDGFVHAFEKKRSVKIYSKIKIYQHQFDQYD